MISVLNLVDLLVNIVAVRILGMNIIEVSILNFIWTLVFVFFIKIANQLGDKGVARLQIILGFIGIVACEIAFLGALSFRNRLFIYLSYSAHAIAYSYVRMGVNAFVFENFTSSEWGSMFRKLSSSALLIDSTSFITISIIGVRSLLDHFSLFIAFTVTAFFLGILVIKEPSLKIERILSRIERDVSNVVTSVHGYLSLTSFENINGSVLYSYRTFLNAPPISLKLILIGLFGFKVGNEFLFTPLPYHFIRTLGFSLDQVVKVYGIGKLVAFILYYLFQNDVTKKNVFLTSIFLRIITVYIILVSGLNDLYIAFGLGFLYLSNSVIDSNIYLLYVEATGGYGTGTYSLIGETSSLIGVITSGYMYSTLGLWYLLAIVSILSMPKIVMALKKPDKI
ncbi:MAG: hypothetical protein QXR24_01000 [Thermosphaera sp.]